MQRNGRRSVMQGWILAGTLGVTLTSALLVACRDTGSPLGDAVPGLSPKVSNATHRDFLTNDLVASIENEQQYQLSMPEKGPYAVWTSASSSAVSRIMFNTRIDGEWAALTQVNDGPTNRFYHHPSITIDDNEVIHVVWVQSNYFLLDHSLRYSYSTDNGQTWSSSVTIVNPESGEIYRTAMASYKNKTYVAWIDDSSFSPTLYATRTTDNGSTWLTPVTVSGVAGLSEADFAVNHQNGLVHLIWTNLQSGSTRIRTASSSDFGEGWGGHVQVDDNSSGAKTNASIGAAPDGTLHATWVDERSGSPTKKIYYAESTNGGATWGSNLRVDDGTTNVTNANPEIAVDGEDRPVVAWRRTGSSFVSQIPVAFKGDGVSNQAWSDPNYIANDDVGTTSALDTVGVVGNPVLVMWGYDTRNGSKDVYSAYEEEE